MVSYLNLKMGVFHEKIKIDDISLESEMSLMEKIEKTEKCAKEGCTFKKSSNKYCGKHQADLFVEETKELGLKHCVNYIRGCRSQNELTYKKSRCELCLAKDREKDKARRKTAVETEEGTKQCNSCSQVFPLEEFQGTRGVTLTCSVCRESNKRADAKRDKEHMNELARKNAQKPERKAVKQEWKEKNPEKCAQYWIDARARLIENDLEGFLKKNAEQAKKWREANPDKVKEINQSKINSIKSQYGVYKTSAKTKRLEFTITEEYFMIMVKEPCYYCGFLQEKGFNGIDRLDSSKFYTKDNCVSCCEMCNMMKGSLSPNVFVHRVEHILTLLQIVQGKLYPDEFSDVKGCDYSYYKNRASSKELLFELSKEVFEQKRKESCYLCGKEESVTHKNGIDRFDNKKGYTNDNTKSCCGDCNYLKRDNDYSEFIDKLMMVYEYQKQSPVINIENKSLKNIVTGNKLSQEEKNDNQIIRKKKQQNELREKYTNEETRKLWISEIVHKRN